MGEVILYVTMYVCSVSILMEFYKKTVRKDKAKAWESWLVAVVLSVPSFWIAAKYAPGLEVPFVMFVVACQYIVDMEVVKRILKAAMEKALR